MTHRCAITEMGALISQVFESQAVICGLPTLMKTETGEEVGEGDGGRQPAHMKAMGLGFRV